MKKFIVLGLCICLFLVVAGTVKIIVDSTKGYYINGTIEKFVTHHEKTLCFPFVKGIIVNNFAKRNLTKKFHSACQRWNYPKAKQYLENLEEYISQEENEVFQVKLAEIHPSKAWKMKRNQSVYDLSNFLNYMKELGETDEEMRKGIKDWAIRLISGLEKYPPVYVRNYCHFLAINDLSLSPEDKEVIASTFISSTQGKSYYDEDFNGVVPWDKYKWKGIERDFNSLGIPKNVLSSMRRNVVKKFTEENL